MLHKRQSVKTSEYYHTSKLLNLLSKDYCKITLDLLDKHKKGLCVTDIYIALRIEQSNASFFLRKMYKYNLVNVEREGKQMIYTINERVLKAIKDKIEEIKFITS